MTLKGILVQWYRLSTNLHAFYSENSLTARRGGRCTAGSPPHGPAHPPTALGRADATSAKNQNLITLCRIVTTTAGCVPPCIRIYLGSTQAQAAQDSPRIHLEMLRNDLDYLGNPQYLLRSLTQIPQTESMIDLDYLRFTSELLRLLRNYLGTYISYLGFTQDSLRDAQE